MRYKTEHATALKQKQESEVYDDLYGRLFRELSSEDLKTFLGDDKEAVKAVQSVRQGIRAMQVFLSQAMPPIVLTDKGDLNREEEEKFREEINSSCVAANILFKRISDDLASCQNRFEKTRPELSEMLRLLKEQSIKDSEILRVFRKKYRSCPVPEAVFQQNGIRMRGSLSLKTRKMRMIYYVP